MMVAIVRGGDTAGQTVGARAAVLNEFLLQREEGSINVEKVRQQARERGASLLWMRNRADYDATAKAR